MKCTIYDEDYNSKYPASFIIFHIWPWSFRPRSFRVAPWSSLPKNINAVTNLSSSLRPTTKRTPHFKPQVVNGNFECCRQAVWFRRCFRLMYIWHEETPYHRWAGSLHRFEAALHRFSSSTKSKFKSSMVASLASAKSSVVAWSRGVYFELLLNSSVIKLTSKYFLYGEYGVHSVCTDILIGAHIVATASRVPTQKW
jgi:hypothetical protein